jgi:hypothetical protein
VLAHILGGEVRRSRARSVGGRSSGDPYEQARAYEVLALACHALGDWQRGMAYELRRQQLAIENGFDVDEALESHLCLWEYHLPLARTCLSTSAARQPLRPHRRRSRSRPAFTEPGLRRRTFGEWARP